MKINVFKTQCRIGTRVRHSGTGEEGVVTRLSETDSKALVLFQGGDKSWEDYDKLELMR